MSQCRHSRFGLLAVAVAALTLIGGPGKADPQSPSAHLAKIVATGTLRVCIWPDYYGISYRNPKNDLLYGIDIELSKAFATDLGVAAQYVDTAFPSFINDLLNDRCDIAMFGVGMLAERMAKVAFSKPYLKSDIFAITLKHSPKITAWADLDRPGNVIAVQAATFMEPVVRARFTQAEIMVVKPPMTRERELEAGRADAFMTDYPYSRRLLDNADWVRLVSPPQVFYELPYGYAVAPGDPEWLARVDAFVADIKRDGRLAAAAHRYGLDAIIVRD